MEDIDGGLHPAVDGQSLYGEDEATVINLISSNRLISSSDQYNEIGNSSNRNVINSSQTNQFKTYQVATVINTM